MKQLFQALKYLHETKQLLHRDLKVENILVEKVDEDNDKVYIKLIDFGFATLLDSDQETLTTQMGTITSYAPEIIQREPVTDKVDIWAAGVIAFYLFSGGNYPFDGETQEELCHEIVNSEPDWAALDESTSPLVKKFIQSCLTKDPARRPKASLLLR